MPEPLEKPIQQISVNQFKTWSRCRKKYFYDTVQKLHWPTDPTNFRLGKLVHKLLDYQSRGLDCGLLLKDADADVRSAWEKLAVHPVPQLPVIANEWGFLVPLEAADATAGSAWLAGRMDRIAERDGKILIIDWKTGTATPRLPENDWQTVVYLYALVEASPELFGEKIPPERVEFVYVEIRDAITEVVIPYNAQKHADAKVLIESTVAKMLSEKTFALPAKCPDPYCPYRAVCGIEG